MKLNVIKSKPKNANAIIINYKKKVLLNLRSKKKYFLSKSLGIVRWGKRKNECLKDTALENLRNFFNKNNKKINIF